MSSPQPSPELQYLRKWQDRLWYASLGAIFVYVLLFQLPEDLGLAARLSLPFGVSITVQAAIATFAIGWILTAILAWRKKDKNMKSSSRKLFWFNRGLLGMAILVLFFQFFISTDVDRGARLYFCLALILLAAGLELVRSELEELRRIIEKRDAVEGRQSEP